MAYAIPDKRDGVRITVTFSKNVNVILFILIAPIYLLDVCHSISR